MKTVGRTLIGLGLAAILSGCAPSVPTSHLGVISGATKRTEFTMENEKVTFSIQDDIGVFSVFKKDKLVQYRVNLKRVHDDLYVSDLRDVRIEPNKDYNTYTFNEENTFNTYPAVRKEAERAVSRYTSAMSSDLISESNERAEKRLLDLMR